jgi:hypothetical protein
MPRRLPTWWPWRRTPWTEPPPGRGACPAAVEYDEAAIARYELLGIERWVRDDSETFWVRVTPETVTGRELDLS